MNRITRILTLAFGGCLALMSCSPYDGLTDFAIPWQDDPEKVKNPIVAAQIQDKGVWVDGIVNGTGITFYLKEEPSNWNNLSIKYTFDESIVCEENLPETVDLTKDCIVKAKDNFVDVSYTITAVEYCPLDNIIATVGTESSEGLPGNDRTVTMLFTSQGLESATVEVILKDGAKMISPSQTKSTQNLTEPVTIKVQDDVKTYEYILSATSMNMPAEWKNITSSYIGQGGVLPGHIKLCEKTVDTGLDINKASTTSRVVAALIPAGHVNMKTQTGDYGGGKNYWYASSKLGDVVSANSTYNLFVGGMSVGFLKPELVPGYMNGGAIVREPYADWNIVYYYTPPTIGVKDGKAEINYAEVIGGKLYKFDTPQFGADKSAFDLSKGEIWDVDAFVTGYSIPLHDGVKAVNYDYNENYGAAQKEYTALWQKERYFLFSTLKDGVTLDNGRSASQGVRKFIVDYWSETNAYNGMKSHWWDGSHMARAMMGTRPNGDLIILMAERYADYYGMYIDAVGYPSRGITFKIGIAELAALGCTDAIAFSINEMAACAVQDGGSGVDITKSLRTKGNDVTNSTCIMFK